MSSNVDVARARGGRRRYRGVRRRHPADAALRARRRHRDVRACSRSRTTSCTYEERIGPGQNAFSSVPETTGLRQAAIGAVVCIVVAFVYARSRFGRLLRATREDDAAARAVGASVYRQRLIAFTVSGLLAGLAGGLYVHLLPVQVNSVYLDLTFITLAMLVVGGATSLFGAVVGALAVSALDSWLVRRRERHVALRLAHRPAGRHARRSSSAILMAAVLILRPSGLTGGRELRLRGVPWRAFASRARA